MEREQARMKPWLPTLSNKHINDYHMIHSYGPMARTSYWVPRTTGAPATPSGQG
ncbi:hypothetical protein CCACVL1_23769, partial [Corchorus capsularis]